MISYRIEQKLVAANTPVAPPERPARLHVASVLPPPPTVSSSRSRIVREPEITSAKATLGDSDDQDGSPARLHVASGPPPPTISSSHTPINRAPQTTSTKATTPDGDGQDVSGSESSDSSVEHSDRRENKSGSEYNVTSSGDTGGRGGSFEPPVRIGPPHRVGPPKLKSTVNVSEDIDLPVGDVSMHSPPHVPHSQRGRGRNVKAIGAFHSQPAKSSGASRSYGGFIGGKALGNMPNIGDLDSTDVNSQFVDVEGTVNLFPSNMRPTTMDIDETAVIAVTIPFEEALAPLLHQVAKYYSPLSGRYFKVYLNIMAI
jgi:hypothetical protein